MGEIRLFVNQTINVDDLIELDDVNQTHYLKNVMRSKIGQKVNIFNEKHGEWVSLIEEINKNKVILKVCHNLVKATQDKELCLCFGLTKWDALHKIARQATKLGVTKLQPLLTNNTIVRKLNISKLEKCVIEAAEQCERITFPKIGNIK
ncbi:MAG: RsmE family RNA methyltransferase [Rickettsiaceae bacterium H1]|nr:RsmE family RNA methyltransferase [Rickettsiaceae bacterium H1]